MPGAEVNKGATLRKKGATHDYGHSIVLMSLIDVDPQPRSSCKALPALLWVQVEASAKRCQEFLSVIHVDVSFQVEGAEAVGVLEWKATHGFRTHNIF